MGPKSSSKIRYLLVILQPFTKLKKIKHIIFDLGGVILNIDYHLTVAAFKKIGISNSKFFYSKKNQNKIFNDIETGKISESMFLENIRNLTKKAKIQDVKKAWNSMLLDLPRERVNSIKKLQNRYSIFLLSNTNQIHITALKNKIGKKRWHEFTSIFNKIYLSHETGFRKPDQKSFQYILEEQKLNPKDVLFIDDSFQHTEAAKQLGIKCHYLKKGEDIITLFPGIIQ